MGFDDFDDLAAALGRSKFRSRFALSAKDRAYLREKGMDAVARHAERLIRSRLAPASPPNDGKQTPMRGHPVFVAQHATSTCCRRCLAKWHGIDLGGPLSDDDVAYIVSVIRWWIDRQAPDVPRAASPTLFDAL